MRRPERARSPLRHALALGVLHGPTELLPISSSAHTTLVPWLLGLALRRPRPRAAQGLRGGAARRAPRRRCSSGCATRWRPPRAAWTTAARCSSLGSFVPPAIVGYTLERPIERRLGTPPTIAVGLLLGSAAMAAADRVGPDRAGAREEAGFADALALGLAQACALIPGASRNGMTLAAARAARLRPRRRQRALAPRRAADHRRGHRAQGRAPGAPRRPAGAGERLRGRRRAPPSSPRWPRCGSSARSSATARSRPTPPTARRSRRWCSGALGRIARDERVLRRRRRRHRRRPTAPSTPSSASCARSSSTGPAPRSCPAATTRRSCAWPRTSASRCRPTAWARRSSSPSRPIAWRRWASTASP